MKIKTLLSEIDKQKKILEKCRDSLRSLEYEISGFIVDSDDAIAGLEDAHYAISDAADALSRQQ